MGFCGKTWGKKAGERSEGKFLFIFDAVVKWLGAEDLGANPWWIHCQERNIARISVGRASITAATTARQL
jgi:hypothetical protein